MDPSAFDTLTRATATSGTRRRLVTLLAALPLVGILAVVGAEESAADCPIDRIQRRTPQRNRKQRNTNNKNMNNKNTKNKKQNNNGGGGGGRPGPLCGGRLCAAEGEVCCGPIAAPDAPPAGSTADTVFVCCPTHSCCGPNLGTMACCAPGQICHARSPISAFCEG